MSENTTTTEATTTETATKTPTPKLKCLVTGRERLTNLKYLSTKASEQGLSVDEFTARYICRRALKPLRAGKTVSEVREMFRSTETAEIPADFLTNAIKNNGKWTKPGTRKAKTTAPVEAVTA